MPIFEPTTRGPEFDIPQYVPLDVARARHQTLRNLVESSAEQRRLNDQAIQEGDLTLGQKRRDVADDLATRQVIMNANGGGPAAAPGGAMAPPPAAPQTSGPIEDITQPAAAPPGASVGVPGAAPQTLNDQNVGQIVQGLRQRGLVKQANDLVDHYNKQRQSQAIASKDNSEAAKFDAESSAKLLDQASSLSGALLNLPPEARAAAYPAFVQKLLAIKAVKPGEMPADYPGDAALHQLHDSGLSAKDQLKKHLDEVEEERKAALAPSVLAESKAKATTAGVLADQMTAGGMSLKDQQELDRQTRANAEAARHNKTDEGIAGGRLRVEQLRYNATLGAGLDANGQPKVGDDGKPIVSPMAKAIANYDAPLNLARLAPAQRDTLMAQIKQENPDFKAEYYQTFQKMENSATSGSIGTSANALSTMMGHLTVLNKAVDALNNGNVQVLNKLANAYGAQTGNDARTVFDTIVHRLGPEVTKAYLASGGSVGERGTNEEDFSSSLGPKQIKSNIGISALLADSKIKALQDQYSRGTYGKGKQKLISDEAEQARQTLTGQAPAAVQDLPTGKGKVIDKATARRFYQAAGGDPVKAQKMAESAGWKVQ